MKRRKFLKTASAAGLGLVAPRRLAFLVSRPSEQVVVAVMGLNGRGAVLGRTFARTPNALVAYVCDVDAQVLAKIGRASCRERVEISVVAVSLKKNNKIGLYFTGTDIP